MGRLLLGLFWNVLLKNITVMGNGFDRQEIQPFFIACPQH